MSFVGFFFPHGSTLLLRRVQGLCIAPLAYGACQRNTSVLNPHTDPRSNSILMPSATPLCQEAPGIASELRSNFPPYMLVAVYCMTAYRRNARAPCEAFRSREPQSSCSMSLLLGLPLDFLSATNPISPLPPLCFSAGLPALVVAVSVGFTRARGYGTTS